MAKKLEEFINELEKEVNQLATSAKNQSKYFQQAIAAAQGIVAKLKQLQGMKIADVAKFVANKAYVKFIGELSGLFDKIDEDQGVPKILTENMETARADADENSVLLARLMLKHLQALQSGEVDHKAINFILNRHYKKIKKIEYALLGRLSRYENNNQQEALMQQRDALLGNNSEGQAITIKTLGEQVNKFLKSIEKIDWENESLSTDLQSLIANFNTLIDSAEKLPDIVPYYLSDDPAKDLINLPIGRNIMLGLHGLIDYLNEKVRGALGSGDLLLPGKLAAIEKRLETINQQKTAEYKLQKSQRGAQKQWQAKIIAKAVELETKLEEFVTQSTPKARFLKKSKKATAEQTKKIDIATALAAKLKARLGIVGAAKDAVNIAAKSIFQKAIAEVQQEVMLASMEIFTFTSSKAVSGFQVNEEGLGKILFDAKNSLAELTDADSAIKAIVDEEGETNSPSNSPASTSHQ